MAEFFIPQIEPEKWEAAYKEMAEFFGGQPLPAGKRVYKLVWRHNGEIWTATVGERLRGVKSTIVGKGINKREQEVPRSASDTVLAIYSGGGVPYLIAHDNAGQNAWNLPILCGDIVSVETFD